MPRSVGLWLRTLPGAKEFDVFFVIYFFSYATRLNDEVRERHFATKASEYLMETVLVPLDRDGF